MSITNTTFDSDLSGWTQTGTGTSFTWTSDNDGSAEVELTGAVHSKKLVQAVDHIGGFVVINASIHAIPGEGNDREDAVVCVLYRGASLVHTERLRTIQAPTSEQDINITDWKIMVPSSITQVGFYLHNVTGTGTCKYQITEFEAEGNDVQEVYQIADYSYDDFSHSATLELLQLSKALISLQGTGVGGDPQGGGEPNNPGSGFNRAYSDGYGSGFA